MLLGSRRRSDLLYRAAPHVQNQAGGVISGHQRDQHFKRLDHRAPDVYRCNFKDHYHVRPFTGVLRVVAASGFESDVNNDVTVKPDLFTTQAKRHWFDSNYGSTPRKQTRSNRDPASSSGMISAWSGTTPSSSGFAISSSFHSSSFGMDNRWPLHSGQQYKLTCQVQQTSSNPTIDSSFQLDPVDS